MAAPRSSPICSSRSWPACSRRWSPSSRRSRRRATPARPTNDAPANGPIAVSQNTTFRAKAWKTGLDPSPVVEIRYELQPTAPIADPAGGTSTAPLTVTLSGPTGATIHYTLDGTEPTTASAEYVGSITVSATSTLQSRAFRSGWTPSPIRVDNYRIVAPGAPPTI